MSDWQSSLLERIDELEAALRQIVDLDWWVGESAAEAMNKAQRIAKAVLSKK